MCVCLYVCTHTINLLALLLVYIYIYIYIYIIIVQCNIYIYIYIYIYITLYYDYTVASHCCVRNILLCSYLKCFVVILRDVPFLRWSPVLAAPDPFCTISCEGEKVKTPVCKDTLNPEWNTGAIFYRAQPTTKQIKISVSNLANGIMHHMKYHAPHEISCTTWNHALHEISCTTWNHAPYEISCTTWNHAPYEISCTTWNIMHHMKSCISCNCVFCLFLCLALSHPFKNISVATCIC